MSKPKLFIGSSQKNVRVARLIRDRLEADGIADVKIWDEGVFGVGQGVLDRLVSEVSKYDFAVLIWGSDDVTESKGESKASPRDNVIFECGLFMGANGRERVFIVRDVSVDVKIPSDLAGTIVAGYEGTRVMGDGVSAVGKACDEIGDAITKRPQPYEKFEGVWRSRYAKAADLGHGEVIDEVDIESVRDGIVIKSKPTPSAESYSARGRVYKNQVMGTWQHTSAESYAEGLFMLVVNPLANVMYGYCTGHDESGAMIFETWVLVKKTGLTESKINAHLRWGEKALKGQTISLPQPEVDQRQ
jgi:hypothetical protein